ncbi:MAG TPA: hypothetical protein VF173_05860 [Thermoanaerobaculia bacterium]|nr:hypothetical protein [Thermoanaerobaculia bacterium]
MRYPDLTKEAILQALTDEEKNRLVRAFFEIAGRYTGEEPERANLLKSLDLRLVFEELLLSVFGPSMRRQ